MTIAALREARAGKLDALKGILAKAESEKRDLNDQEQSAFDAGRKEVEKLERDIRNQEFLNEAERRATGQPIAGSGDRQFDVECREFSLRRAIAAQIPGLAIDCGREREISQELERRSGRPAQGIFVPLNALSIERRVTTSALPAGGPGGTLIPMDWRPEMFIDVLRASMAVRRLGARVLDGLTGNVGIPALSASATMHWVAENAAISASDAEFTSVTMTPKHAGVITEVSRNMILQSSPDIEQLLRSDFAQLLAAGLDTVAIKGGGSDEPTGVLAATGVTEVSAAGGAGGAIAYQTTVVPLISAVAGENALAGSLGFLTNSKVVGKASTILKTTSDTSSNFIIPDPGAGTLAGYPLAMSNLVPSTLTKGGTQNCSALIFGNWADMLIGFWSQLDLLVNPFESTAYSKGNVLIRAMMTCDVTLRHVKSFAFAGDITTV